MDFAAAVYVRLEEGSSGRDEQSESSCLEGAAGSTGGHARRGTCPDKKVLFENLHGTSATRTEGFLDELNRCHAYR